MFFRKSINITKKFEKDIPLPSELEDTIPFRNIQSVLNRKIRISEFIIAILEDKIQSCGTIKEEIGLNKLIFRVNDVIPLFKKDHLTLGEAANLIMVGNVGLSGWIRNGFLKATGRRYQISKEDLDIFIETYIPLISLVKLHHKIGNGKRLYEWLEEKGILPVSGPRIDSAKFFLYEINSDLKNAMNIDSLK